MGRLDNRAAIVTGGAKGIGRHYSLALAAEGARVMIADIADGAERCGRDRREAWREFGRRRDLRHQRRGRREDGWSRARWSASGRSTCW